MKMIAAGTLALAANIAQPRAALAWGDDGDKVVALIAQSFLEKDVRKRVNALLSADTDSLTAHDIASAATWADKYRDSNIDGATEDETMALRRYRDCCSGPRQGVLQSPFAAVRPRGVGRSCR